MTTTSDRLALLQRTKAGQRALLEEMYPDLDFSTVPFREYGRLFTGRKYVPGFVGGWKGYGRSNSEDASTREILPDYSGNGRDIRLYNFAFAGMSGWGGYGSTAWSAFGDNAEQVNSNTVKIVGPEKFMGVRSSSISKGESLTIRYRIAGLPSGSTLELYTNTRSSEGIITFKLIREIKKDGIYTDIATWDSENAANDATASIVYLVGRDPTYPEDMTVLIEQLPLYPGALVSDGVDDYGQCIKGFALPDDYTVVAIRRIIEGHDGGFVSKGSTGGAFIFDSTRENIYSACWSYGVKSTGTPMPSLFSYQMKGSYNGQEISYGTAEDTAEDQLTVFRHGTQLYCQGVLYDLRIYDHTLTAEELQAVKDEMMSDYENATGGGIADIHYVADWDAKGRSNDEEEPMRSQWTDKATGKVIDLNNFGFAGMSGWGGYGIDCSKVLVNGPQDLVDGNVLQVNAITNGANFLYGVKGMDSVSMKIRVEGISRAVAEGVALYLQIYFSSSGGERLRITEDGVHDVNLPVLEGATWLLLYIAPAISSPDWTPIDPVTVEVLPSYPGALVCDGIDDYGLTQEAINEEVGTVLLHYRRLVENPVNWGYYMDGLYSSRLYIAYEVGGDIYTNLTGTIDDGKTLIGKAGYTGPATEKLNIASNYQSKERGQIALYRLILIREQLDEAQIAYLVNKVQKEYNDWCKANGYEYAINQLTA